MKHFLRYPQILIAIAFIMMTACSKEEPSQPVPAEDGTAMMFRYEPLSLKDSSSIELPFATALRLEDIEELRTLFPFYSLEADDTDIWFPIPNVDLDANYKTWYSHDRNSENGNTVLKIFVEKFDSQTPISNALKIREVRVIAVKTSVLRNLKLTREKLDTRNHNELIQYFGLKME